MRPLLAQDILKIWERGQHQQSLDKALTLLSVSFSESTRDRLAALTIGQRDAYLLTLRELTFGHKLNSFAKCPKCLERLEFDMSTKDIRVVQEPYEVGHIFELAAEDFLLRFRLPNSFDLAAVAECKDVATARILLVQRCVQQAIRNGVTVPTDELPGETLGHLAVHMARCDPQAEVLLDLHCPECGHSWQIIFDVVSFFWTEISSHARQLLEEVHTLARAYGWNESDILSMSQTRRRFYLDMVE